VRHWAQVLQQLLFGKHQVAAAIQASQSSEELARLALALCQQGSAVAKILVHQEACYMAEVHSAALECNTSQCSGQMQVPVVAAAQAGVPAVGQDGGNMTGLE
jgi:hypothetical protein